MTRRLTFCTIVGTLLAFLGGGLALADDGEFVIHSFEKKTLTEKFYCEGAHYGDINRDGKMDIVSGPFWYAGPSFEERHEFFPVTEYPKAGYSHQFFTFTHDFDGDGWTDVLIVGFPGAAAHWYENPAGGSGHWKKHLVFDVIDNESPSLIDMVGDEQPELLFHYEGRFGYAAFDRSKPRAKWTFHPVSGKIANGKYQHGLGYGDVTGDGKNEIFFRNGWLEQPATLEEGKEWTFHEFNFSPRLDGNPGVGMGGAQMYAYDFDGDGDNDVVTSLEAHAYGLSWFEQVRDDGKITFREHRILGRTPEENPYGVCHTQMHAIDLIDMDGDGVLDIVTGKRHWAHNGHDPEGNAPPLLFWYRTVRQGGSDVDFVPYRIDDDSGVGTQIVAGDVSGDGLPDVVVGNKKGTFVFLHRVEKTTREKWLAVQPERRGKAD